MAIKKDLFSRLQRLFSNDVVIRNTGGQLKVIDTNKIQSYGNIQTNNMVDRFSRVYKAHTTSAYLNSSTNYQAIRTQLYTDYEAMDTESIIHSVLDIIADECTLKNENHEILQIKSSDENIQKLLYNLFYDVLNIEFNLWTWIRQMCKYGDCYLHLSIAEKFGVYNVIPLSSYDIVRIEGMNPENPSEVHFEWDPNSQGSSISLMSQSLIGDKKKFENYEMAHFRLLSDPNFLPYGSSYLEGARKTYKSYVMLKDAALIHRIMRAAEKRIFYIDVGNIPPAEVDSYMQKVVTKMKKTPYIDPQTGDYNLRYNMMNALEDFYLPVRGQNSNTKIDTLKGLDYAGMDDLVFMRDELFAALKVPKAFMGFEKDLCISPETKIPLLDGRTLTALEIIDEFKKGIKNYVYSLDEKTKNIVPGEIEWAGYTRMDTQTLKIWLDNNEYIQCTPDHLFLTRDGVWKEAQILVEGESLYSYFPTISNVIDGIEINYHKVSKIEWCEELIDTCDLTITKYHNFGTHAGVIIHNSGKSTLAAEDIRFARTVERIQRIIVSELTKIALVHLSTQGYNHEDLVNFELSLTPPSIVYQQEMIALWKEKIGLAQDMLNTGLFPSDFIYDKICQLSEEKYREMRDLVIEDKKRVFRLNQLENEGNDPFKTGKSFGTPHDLAALYGKSYTSQEREVPDNYDETKPLGRPVEKSSNYGTQNSNLGRDPLGNGNNGMKEPTIVNPLNEYRKKSLFESLKTIKFSKLLDEDNIKKDI